MTYTQPITTTKQPVKIFKRDPKRAITTTGKNSKNEVIQQDVTPKQYWDQ